MYHKMSNIDKPKIINYVLIYNKRRKNTYMYKQEAFYQYLFNILNYIYQYNTACQVVFLHIFFFQMILDLFLLVFILQTL